jgi:hypothetical protein
MLLAATLASCNGQNDPVMPDGAAGYHISSRNDGPAVNDDQETFSCSMFNISGTVFVDSNADGIRNSTDESGIGNVTVTLSYADGELEGTTEGGDLETTITDSNGHFVFTRTAGTYEIRIDAETDAGDFNERLAASFDATGPTSLTVTVGPDSPGNDFGYDPRAEEITNKIALGIILTNGEDAKFWRKQNRMAISGGNGGEYGTEEMAQFITDVEGLYFPNPFQFTPGNEFQEAINVLHLKGQAKENRLRILLKELLTAEFNEVSGRGLVEAPKLQKVLLAWAESIAIRASAGVPQSMNGPLLGGPIDDRVGDAIDLLIQLNGSSAGGGGGGG